MFAARTFYTCYSLECTIIQDMSTTHRSKVQCNGNGERSHCCGVVGCSTGTKRKKHGAPRKSDTNLLKKRHLTTKDSAPLAYSTSSLCWVADELIVIINTGTVEVSQTIKSHHGRSDRFIQYIRVWIKMNAQNRAMTLREFSFLLQMTQRPSWSTNECNMPYTAYVWENGISGFISWRPLWVLLPPPSSFWSKSSCAVYFRAISDDKAKIAATNEVWGQKDSNEMKSHECRSMYTS